MSKNTYKKGKVKGQDIDLELVDFAVDTALSWDGQFPKPGKGDYLVNLLGAHPGAPYDNDDTVLVSRRYTSAVSSQQAGSIAKDAYAERHGYKKKDVRIVRVDSVT